MGQNPSKFDVEVVYDTLSWIKGPTDEFRSEPYMWIVFFKADGETLFWDETTGLLRSKHYVPAPEDPPLTAVAAATATATAPTATGNSTAPTTTLGPPGSGGPHHPPKPGHWEFGSPQPFISSRGGDGEGDLGVDGVLSPATITIPASLGKFNTTLTPIPAVHPGSGTATWGGYVGTIFVLMEADHTSQGTRFLADSWFWSAVSDVLSAALGSITIGDFETSTFSSKIDDLTTYVDQRVLDIIRDNTSVDPDDKIGVRTIFWRHQDLAGGPDGLKASFEFDIEPLGVANWTVRGRCLRNVSVEPNSST